MKLISPFLAFSLLLLLSSCTNKDCNNLTNEYTSYEEALATVRHTHFKVKETISNTESSWIKTAFYYSCDEITGYLIIETYTKEYIHLNMPMDVWNEFKIAKSKGGYYNQNIKGRYRLVLKN